MLKKELFAAFHEKISQTAITNRWPIQEDPVDPYEWAIVGRYCRVTDMPSGAWDLWLCNPRDLAAELSPRKVTGLIVSIANKLWPGEAPFSPENAARKAGWRILTGEAVCQSLSIEQILLATHLLGIRRKPNISLEKAQAAAKRLNRGN